MTNNNPANNRLTVPKRVIIIIGLILAGISYVEADSANGKTVAALAAVFALLAVLRDIGDQTSTFKKWFSRIVLALIVVLTLVVIVGDLIWFWLLDTPIELSDILAWLALIFTVIGGFVERFIPSKEPV